MKKIIAAALVVALTATAAHAAHVRLAEKAPQIENVERPLATITGATLYKNWKIHSVGTTGGPFPGFTMTIEAADGRLVDLVISYEQWLLAWQAGVGSFVTVFDHNSDGDTLDAGPPTDYVVFGPM